MAAFCKFGFGAGVGGHRRDIGIYMSKTDQAKIPFSVKSVDDVGLVNEAGSYAAASGVPHNIILRFTKPGGLPNDHPDLSLGALGAARQMADAVLDSLSRDPDIAKYKKFVRIQPTNEVSTNDHSPHLIGMYMYYLGKFMNDAGWAAALGGFNAGQPRPEHWDEPGMVEFLSYVASTPQNTISVHEGKIDDKKTIYDPVDEFYPHLIGRYQMILEACDRHGLARVGIDVDEWAWSYRDMPDLATAMVDVETISEWYARHKSVKGVFGFTLQGGDQWSDLPKELQRLIIPVTDFTLRVRYPDPVDPVDPGDPDNPILDPIKKTYIMIPPWKSLSTGEQVEVVNYAQAGVEIGPGHKTGGEHPVTPSHVDFFQNVLLGAEGTKGLIYKSHKIGTGLDQQWVQENVPEALNRLFWIEAEADYLSVTPLWQRDPRWANVPMGSGKTIGNWGCLLVVYLMQAQYWGLSSVEPPAFMDIIRAGGGMNGPFMLNGALQKAFPDVIGYRGFKDRTDPQMVPMIRQWLDDKIPVPARVDFIPDTSPRDQHWILLIGYTEDDWWMADPWTGKIGKVSDVYPVVGEDILEALFYELVDENGPLPDPEPSPPVPAWGSMVRGLDNPASDWRWPEAKAVFDLTGLRPKFHTSGNNYKWFNQYKHPAFNPVRVVIDRGFSNRDPAAIWNEMKGEIAKFWNLNVRNFIFLNEPNIEHESLGKLWDNGTQFGKTFKTLCEKAKTTYPGIKIWMPGMSPGFGAEHKFLDDARAAGGFTHIFGMTKHVYSGTTNSAETAKSGMISEVMEFRRRQSKDLPLIIGEFAVNRPASAVYKARVAGMMYNSLSSIRGVWGAYCFTSDWHPSADANQEGWLRYGIHIEYANL